MTIDKQKIRSLFFEFQGYLSQTPIPKHTSDIFSHNSSWERYNSAVKELSSITGEDHSRFQVQPKMQDGFQIVCIETYRQALGGLINRLHCQYFSDEQAPFSGTPHTVISQNQYQTQSVQMILDLQSRIDENLQKFQEDTPKKKFLEKLKSKLSGIKNVNDLLGMILKLAKEFNINLNELTAFFG